ncbi:Hypothetical protein A7982_10408 [Minicystis rosea]|nr:Hypothetical protein A7982_10408 [Minicystis rosea]
MRASILCGAALFALSISSAAAAAEGPIVAAQHHGVVRGEVIRWTSNYVLRREAPPSITLAYPLPVGAVLEVSPDVSAEARAGRVTAIRLGSGSVEDGRVTVAVTAPLERLGRDVRLAPPLAAGDAVQIVEVEGSDELRFEPEPRTELARHVGFFAPVDLPWSARDACDRIVGYVRVRLNDDPMYLKASAPIVAAEGIRGRLVSHGDRIHAGALGAGGAFIALVVGLGLLLRRLARAAKIEEGERAMAEEFAKLDRRPSTIPEPR